MSIIDLKMILMFVMAAVPFTFAMRFRDGRRAVHVRYALATCIRHTIL